MADQRNSGFSQTVPEEMAPDFKDFYSNFVRVGMTPFDLSMTFGQIKTTSPQNSLPEAKTHATVIMSPYHFKAYVMSVNHLLAEWERQFGSVNLADKYVMNAETFRAAAKRKPSDI